jgi:hypothetical protein
MEGNIQVRRADEFPEISKSIKKPPSPASVEARDDGLALIAAYYFFFRM